MEQKKWKHTLHGNFSAAAVAALVAAGMLLTYGCASTDAAQEETAQEQTQEEQTQEAAETGEEPENNLEENTHGSIDRLIEKYCTCLAEGDVESLEAIVDVLTDEEKEKIENRAAFIEAFENVECYTKNGPEDDSYIVFVCYDMKLINIETAAPDIICLYVLPKDDSGNRLIHYGDIDESMQAYVEELEQDPEVQALYDDVRTRYQEAQENDESLAEFIQKISGQVTEDDEEETEETGESEEAQSEEDSDEETEETESEESDEETGEAEAQNRETRVTESVNVRAEASTDSERLALAYKGDAITEIESYDNGWSKVEYQGQTGYVKTEFLE